LQPRMYLLTFANQKTFSILCRIEWVATLYPDYFPPLAPNFQYSVSDRMGCNSVCPMAKPALGEPFSILCRIEWVATNAPDDYNCFDIAFQYPVSDRMGCNVYQQRFSLK